MREAAASRALLPGSGACTSRRALLGTSISRCAAPPSAAPMAAAVAHSPHRRGRLLSSATSDGVELCCCAAQERALGTRLELLLRS